MTTGSTKCESNSKARKTGKLSALMRSFPALVAVGFGLSFAMTGCETTDNATPLVVGQGANKLPAEQVVREGDVLKISFPGAPSLDTTQTVRRDGRISLNVVGEVTAAGLTPAALEKQLVQLYSSQLVEKEVNVTVVSSSFSVFVTGAVIRPGKINSDHPITILDAIMEAGGFDNTRADPKSVLIVRVEDGRTKTYKVNVKDIIDGRQTVPVYLQPSDSVIVKERFSVFD